MTEVELNDGKVVTNADRHSTAPAIEQTAMRGTAANETESFGRTLAIARKARGLSQGEVAAQLRLQLRQVRAIEAEDLGQLPEGPFVRGFVRNYARLVNLPAEPLLASLAAKLKPYEPLRADAAGAVSPVRLAAREHASRVTVVGGAVLLLLLFAVLGWWTMLPVQNATSEAAPAVPVPAVTPAAPPAPAAEASEPPATAPAAATTEAPTTTSAAPAASAGDSAPALPAALQFSFRDRAWVEVRQADGTLLMSRNNDAGARETLDGTPPYTLVIGNASKVDLQFRGKPVDLAAIASSADVARLRLE